MAIHTLRGNELQIILKTSIQSNKRKIEKQGMASLQNVKGAFIVIEGLDATGKTTLVENITFAIAGSTSMRSPPRIEATELFEGDVRGYFDKRPSHVRRAYYDAANLIASELATVAINSGTTVIMDRYWTSTVAFSALDQTSTDAEDHEFLRSEYPAQLLVPDVVILLTVNEETRLRRMQNRGQPSTEEEHKLAVDTIRRQKVLSSYRSFDHEEIDTSALTASEVLNESLIILRSKNLI
jgi:thymidylate kinase